MSRSIQRVACSSLLLAAMGVGFAFGAPSSPVLIRVRGADAVTLDQAVARWQSTETARSAPLDSLTPVAAREFLELLANEAVLTAAALEARPAWTPEDRRAHEALRDRLVLRAALDSVLEATRLADPDSASDAESLGMRARTRVVEGLGIRWEEARVARIAAAFRALPHPTADSSLAAQMRMLERTPALSREDSSGAVARAGTEIVTGREVVQAWTRIGVARRPRIESEEHVRNLAENLLFERALRTAATHGSFASRPEFRAVLDEHARSISLQRWLEREVLARITPDSAAMRAYYEAHRAEWRLPLRVRGIRLTLDDRAAADRMALVLRDEAAAERLATQALKGGTEYRFEASAASDSVLFHRALEAGSGSVIGPVAEAGAWWVARVSVVVPGRDREFGEVRETVADRWYATEAERRTRALAARLAKDARVEIVEGAAEALTGALRGLALAPDADVNPR